MLLMGTGLEKKVEIDLGSEVQEHELFVYQVKSVKNKEKSGCGFVISKKKENNKNISVTSKPIKVEGKEIYLARS
jgi:hypothetical protein